MKSNLLALCLLLLCGTASAQYTNDSEGIPDKDLFGNYVIIRITPLCESKGCAINEINKFKLFCEENNYLKAYTQNIGFWQVKSVNKEKNGKWIGGYCNFRRQNKELYELDKRFIQMYCENADIWQFKDLLKNSQCLPEEVK